MMQRITLLMLSRMGAGDGGRETWLANFLDEMVRQGREVTFDVIHQHAGAPTLLEATSRSSAVGGVQQIRCRWMWCPVSLEFLMRLVFGRYSIPRAAPLLAVGGLAEALAALLVTLGRGKASRIMWLRSIYTREKSAQLPGPLMRLVAVIERLVLRRFGLVLANGADTAAFYSAIGIECHVIANAVPLAKWAMPAPDVTEPLRVAFVGRLTEVKGINQFLKAVEFCEREAPGRCTFHVAGDGPARISVEALTEHAALTFHGQVDNDDTREIVRDSDVCVALTLSSTELGGGGVSNALIEQMAAGRIVVAWDNDIFRQVLSPEAAYLVSQGDSSALGEIFLHVASNRLDALERADRARQLASRYSISGHVDRFFDLLKEGKRDQE